MFNKEDQKKMLMATILITIGMIVYHVLGNLMAVSLFLRKGLGILSPITVGFIMFYIINIPMKTIEKRLFSKRKLSAKLKRAFALSITLVLFALFFTVFFFFAVPQLAESIGLLVNQLPSYAVNAGVWLEEEFIRLNISSQILSQLENIWTDFIGSFASIMLGIVNSASFIVGRLVSGVFNLIISTALMVYMLLGKEHIASIFNRLWKAYSPKRLTEPTIKYLKIIDGSFEQFIRGQLMEALALGIVCYIGMSILGWEYALLISFIVGVTNVIPILGPYIGAIPSFFLLLMVNPIHAIWFILYVTVLQQLESNLLYPRIVGEAMGISGFWIMIAVVLGNNLFGVAGILMGIPLLSSFYTIIREITGKRLAVLGQTKAEEEREMASPHLPN